MKKFTFILFALITGTSFAQEAGTASATADINADIVTPITITSNETPLNFGSIVAADGGKVRVSTAGTRTFSNNNMEVITSTEITAASFDVTAANEYAYSISIPSTELEGDGVNMPVSFTYDLEGITEGNGAGTGAAQTLLVGGLLTVADEQAEGTYEGEVEVTVAYE